MSNAVEVQYSRMWYIIIGLLFIFATEISGKPSDGAEEMKAYALIKMPIKMSKNILQMLPPRLAVSENKKDLTDDEDLFDSKEDSQIVEKVVNGVLAKPGDVPYIVRIVTKNKYADNYIHLCGGSIISDLYVITAAHCFQSERNKNPKNILAIAGSVESFGMDSMDQVRDVDEIILHKYYTMSNETGMTENDIALLKLSNGFEFSGYVLPVQIPLKNEIIKEPGTHNCIISGWGKTGVNESVTFELNLASVKILPKEECSDNLTETQLCAGDLIMPKDTCGGDSGGPLVCDNMLAGIVSGGIKNCTGLGVYTSVGYFWDWIYSNVRGE